MPSNHLVLCCPLPLLPSVFPSIRVFPSKSVLHIKWPQYWGFRISLSPSSGYSGLISFKIGCFDLLTVQGTLQSLSLAPQFESINSLVLSHLSEKAMAPHSSTLAWKIPWTEEPGGLQSMGSLRVGHD